MAMGEFQGPEVQFLQGPFARARVAASPASSGCAVDTMSTIHESCVGIIGGGTESSLWEDIPSVPDLQCVWQILVQSANPRSNQTIRTLPPSQSAEYT